MFCTFTYSFQFHRCKHHPTGQVGRPLRPLISEVRAEKVRSEGLAVDPASRGWVRIHPPGGTGQVVRYHRSITDLLLMIVPAFTHRYIHGCMYVCMYVGTYVCMYVCMYACMHACTYVRMYVYSYIFTDPNTSKESSEPIWKPLKSSPHDFECTWTHMVWLWSPKFQSWCAWDPWAIWLIM